PLRASVSAKRSTAMAVKRIVANIAAPEPAALHGFYKEVLGLDIGMDMGWIVTYVAEARATAQVSVMSEGGSGTPVPDISVEVDELDAVYWRAKSGGFEIVYEITEEPWGVRRFFVRDPAGKIVNVLEHLGG